LPFAAAKGGIVTYNPFLRGAHPVGVRTIELADPQSDARALTEIWYPADPRYRGLDLDDATRDEFSIVPALAPVRQSAVRDAEPASVGRLPLVLQSHGGYGHRREMTHLATHLASQGYVVAAPDYPGDNVRDSFAAPDPESAAIAKTPIDESARNRPRQASHFIEQVIALAPSLGIAVNEALVGACGMSMGGFTSLALNSVSRRSSATFAVCPLCGTRSMVPQIHRLQSLLSVDDWGRPVPTLMLTGAADPIVIAADVRDLYGRLRAPKRLAIVDGAGHMHFADYAEAVHETSRRAYLSGSFPDPEIDAIALGTAMRPFAELLSEALANETARGLGLAHFDAVLKRRDDARAFLDGALTATFAARGITLNETGSEQAERFIAVSAI
jgi:predicted dienelactone hydrolase